MAVAGNIDRHVAAVPALEIPHMGVLRKHGRVQVVGRWDRT
jgi:hypothetical protein